VFNIQGSEMIFLLLVALIVLGPEKLPDAVRKAGRAYAEFKKMANGFQGELKTALDDPMRELRDTAEAMRQAVNFDTPAADPEPEAAAEPPPIVREPGLNFGSANPRPKPEVPPEPAVEPTPIVREPGLNFGSANPRPKPQDPAE
jgi:sec-independent protein translocase protein TatB